MTNLNDIKPIKVRTLEDFKQFLFNYLPIGLLWNNLNEEFHDLLEAFAEEFNRNDQRNVDLQCEVIPGLSTELLEQWEQDVLLPEELPTGGETLQERRDRVQSKLFNTPNNPTEKFFKDLALDRGIAIDITFVSTAFRVGVNRMGTRIHGTTSVYIWIVDWISGSKTEYAALDLFRAINEVKEPSALASMAVRFM